MYGSCAMASETPERRRRLTGRALTLSAAAVGAGAGIALQRRHARLIARDPDYARLTAPLEGDVLPVRSSDGTDLHVESFGADDQAVVLLVHGWTEQLSFWRPVIRVLRGRGLRLVAYDLRGHGRSGSAADGDYSLARYGDDLEAVLAAVVGDGQRAVIAGHSLGAMSIAAWAERHEVERRARAAAMLNTGLGDLVSGQLLLGGLTARFSSPFVGRLMMRSRAPLPSFSSPLAHTLIRHVAFGPDATAGQVAFYERMLIECPPKVRAATGIAISDMDLWQAVARITVPTLVIAGSDDRLTPPAHARRIADTLPRPAGLIELERTGHMTPLERPAEVADALHKLAVDTAPVVGTAAVR
jgi:pimeloyl-ACP methyl ester carboxylesterase